MPRLLDLDMRKILSMFLLAIVACSGGLYGGDISELSSKLKTNIPDKDKVKIYMQLGDIHYASGRFSEALKSYLSALNHSRSKKQSLLSMQKLANVYRTLGNIDKSIELLKDAVKIKPSDISMRKQLAGYYAESDLYDFAIKEYIGILAISPDRDAFESLGDIYRKKGLYNNAINYYKKAVFIEPSPSVFQKISACYENLGEPELAVMMLKESLAKSPNYEGYLQLGKFYYNNGEYLNASDAFSSAIRLAPDKSEAFAYAGIAYYKAARYKEAEEIFKIITDKKEMSALASFFLGLIYKKTGNYENSRDAFTKAGKTAGSELLKKYAALFSP